MRVRFYATLRQIVGASSVELALHEAATVQQLLDALLAQYPALRHELIDENGRLFQHVNLFVNSRNALFLERGMDTALPENAEIGIFPAVGGG
jgi:sulfur-carrier protein